MLRICWQEKTSNETDKEWTRKRQLWTLYDTGSYCFSDIFVGQDDRLVKKALLCSVNSVWQRGRPPKRWTDDVTDWTKLTLYEAVRSSQDRETWSKIVIADGGIRRRRGPVTPNAVLISADGAGMTWCCR